MSSKKGMTLIELILGLALMSLILAFVFGFFAPMLKLTDAHTRQVQAKNIAQTAMAYLKEEIHCAKGEVVTGNAGPVVLSVNANGDVLKDGAVVMPIASDEYRMTVIFTGEASSVSIRITVTDLNGKELYQITTSVAATDANAVYSGVASGSLSMEQRTSCK